MIHSRIAGTGSYLPPRIVTNAEFSQRLETSDEWIRERTGIAQRHIADEGLRDVKIITAIYESIKLGGQPVQLC